MEALEDTLAAHSMLLMMFIHTQIHRLTNSNNITYMVQMVMIIDLVAMETEQVAMDAHKNVT